MRPRRLASWLSVWFRSTPSRSSSPRHCRLKTEALEDRLAPATITVLTTGDAAGPLTPTGPDTFTAPTLRAAIDAANDEVNLPGADTITFAPALAGQTITAVANDTTNPLAFGPTAFVITSDITIAGDPNAAFVTISGNNSHRIFAVTTGSSLTLQFLTLTGGNAAGNTGGGSHFGGNGGGSAGLGGAIFSQGSLTLQNSILSGNIAQGGDGGGNYGTSKGGAGGAGLAEDGANAPASNDGAAGGGALGGCCGGGGEGGEGGFGGGGGGGSYAYGNSGAGGFGGGGGGAVYGSFPGRAGFGAGLGQLGPPQISASAAAEVAAAAWEALFSSKEVPQ